MYEKKGVLLCLISAFCYALGPVIGKVMFNIGLPWRVVATMRLMIPALLLLLICLSPSEKILKKSILYVSKSAAFRKDHIKWFIMNGLSISLISVCNYCAIYYINASVATVLLYTLPVFTVILSRFMLKEHFTTIKILATVFVFTGCVLIVNLQNVNAIAAHPDLYVFGVPSVIFGVVLGTLGGVMSALYTICTKKLSESYDGWTVNCWCYFIAFPVAFCVGIGPVLSFSWTVPLFLFVLLLAIINLSAYSLYTLSLQFIQAGKASLLVTLDPVMSITMCVVILGESLTLLQFIGCLCVAFGILFMEFGKFWLEKIKLVLNN